MRTLMVIFTLVMTGSLLAQAEDMQKYLNDTRALVKAGKHKEAFERYQWFHDHALEHAPHAMYGVRLSYALFEWKNLGDKYPPALVALKKTRDDKTDLLEKGKGKSELFHDVVALNNTLGDDSKSIALFRKLDKDQAALAKKCWGMVKEEIIKNKEYDLAKKYIGDPVLAFGEVKGTFEQMKAMNEEESMGPEFKTYIKNSFIKETLSLIEVALATDNEKAAKEIQAKALKVFDDRRLQNAIPKKKKETKQQQKSPDKKE